MSIRDVASPRVVTDLTDDDIAVTAQVTDPDHHGPRVKLDAYGGGHTELLATFFLSPTAARHLASALWDSAADAEDAYDRRQV